MPIFMLKAIQFVKTVGGIIFRHPITGTTIIPLMSDGKIVLVRRQDTGEWGLPGGFVEWGEDIRTTAHREIAEETGLELVKICRLVGVYSSMDRDPRVHSITVVVEAQVQGNSQVKDTLEIAEAKAFSQEEIPLGSLCHDHDRQLQDYFNGLTTIA